MTAKETWNDGYRPDSYMKGAQGMETQEPYRYMRHGFNPKTGDDEYLLASGEDKVGIIKNKKWVALITNRLNSHAALLTACKFFMKALDDQILVRNTEYDDEPKWALQMVSFVRNLQQTQAAIDEAENN